MTAPVIRNLADLEALTNEQAREWLIEFQTHDSQPLEEGTYMPSSEIYALADNLFWALFDQLDEKNKDKLVMEDPDDEDATRNTELGSQFYYALEDLLFETFNVHREE